MISVVVPTFDRPDSLKRAVRSLFAQTRAAEGFKLIIVDNTPTGTATAAIAELRRSCPPAVQLIALSETDPGVANARNTALTACSHDLVAFLDDDQSAPETWLETLLASFQRFPAAVTFGPVRTALPDGQRRHQAYFEAFFAREPALRNGFITESFGCGNALIDFSQVPGKAPWFDTRMNECGGEDDVLFRRIERADRKFAWADEAPVFEHPPAERVTLRYTLKRAFSFGQAPITLALKQSPKRYEQVLLWMLIGAAKTVRHGVQWAVMSLIRHPRRAFQLDLAIRGASKLVWWVDLKFYGAAALKSAPKPPQEAGPAPDLGDARRV